MTNGISGDFWHEHYSADEMCKEYNNQYFRIKTVSTVSIAVSNHKKNYIIIGKVFIKRKKTMRSFPKKNLS